MPGDIAESAFERWQEAQRQLQALEREILDRVREQKSRRGAAVPDDIIGRAHELRLQVDALLPAAMQELEDQVSKIKSRRPKLADL